MVYMLHSCSVCAILMTQLSWQTYVFSLDNNRLQYGQLTKVTTVGIQTDQSDFTEQQLASDFNMVYHCVIFYDITQTKTLLLLDLHVYKGKM